MNISAPFIRRPVGTVLLAIGLFIAGIVAYEDLPVANLPNVDLPTLSVRASQPGADPETMAATVAAPLERRIGEISGITELTSTSRLGSSNVSVQFELSRDIEDAARDVQAAINGAQADLPGNLSRRPTVRKSNPSATPILILAVTSPIRKPEDIYDIADLVLATRLASVPGVAEVQLGGSQQPAIRVTVEPAALNARGIGLEDVRAAISDANALLPLGQIDGPEKSFVVSTGGQLRTVADYASIVLKNQNGIVVRLGDIAKIEQSRSSRLSDGWFNKDPAVILIIQKTAEGNIVETVDAINAMLPELKALIPPDMNISVMSDRTTGIRTSIKDLEITLSASIALVTLVVFVFLRRLVPTFAAMISVPLSLAGTVILMWFAGFSLDNISLLALTISVGFVVDDAIVMIENCYRNMQAGLRPVEAAMAGAKQIGFTIVSISISLIAAFIPLLFMPGVLGRILGEFGWTLAFSIIISAVISLTLTPMICGRFMRRLPQPRETWLDRRIEPVLERLSALYERSLDWALAHRFLMLMTTFVVLALTVMTFFVLPKGLIPSGEETLIMGSTRAEPDVSFETISRLHHQVTDIIRKDPDVVSVGASIGGTSGFGANNQGRFFVTLKPHEEREATTQEVIERLRRATRVVTGAEVSLNSPTSIRTGARSSRSNYQVTLWSTDLATLAEWTPKALAAARTVPSITDVNSDREAGGPQAFIQIDRDRAAHLGVSMRAVNSALNNAFSEREVSTIYGDRNQYRVILEADPKLQRSLDGLARIFVTSSRGAEVPISAFATITTSSAPLVVNHQNQFPAVTISFNLKENETLEGAVDGIMEALNKLRMPGTIRVQLAGDTATQSQQGTQQPLLILAALITVYLVLGILYEDLVHPLTILSTLPSAGLGALLILHATGSELSLIALIGIILLIGIVKKNGIMLVDFALEAERSRGLTGEEAIRHACHDRFRPILMTTLAAMLGALPLILATGPGSELRIPLGLTIIGGLAVSQVLTVYTTPVIYIFLDKLRRRGKPAPSVEQAPAPSAV
ncbi:MULTISPECIES: efflux RND transporter permease subunit [Rhodomicrobium]|uniref:efflux RND transporter permease subunit n=1 Tax=Rhodomicrobium TaxID=1068 RepID=UPI000B4AE15F|nr:MULTISPECIES: efflux RND transporter permease subunit [Rhodomicrobium]